MLKTRMQSRNLWTGILLASVAIAALPVGAQGLAGPAEGESIAQWADRWMDGPARLIATGEEKEIYASLGSARERLQFIRLFWERRDPQYRGPRNESISAAASSATAHAGCFL